MVRTSEADTFEELELVGNHGAIGDREKAFRDLGSEGGHAAAWTSRKDNHLELGAARECALWSGQAMQHLHHDDEAKMTIELICTG